MIMALPLGKLTILIGAGVLGSILAKEGRMPSVSDVVSGALKIALKPIKQNDSSPSVNKPKNDALMAQVNSLRQELQLLSSNRPVTIVTSRTSGGRQYGVIIVIIVLGYGYVWWKGWKLPDFMFATKRGLKDACDSVSKELDKVFHSVKVTRNHVSSKLHESSSKYDEIVTCTTTAKDEVSHVRGKVSKFKEDLQTVNLKFGTLKTKMGRIQEIQDNAKEGIAKLMLCTLTADDRLNGLTQDGSSSASRPALEPPRLVTSLRTGSLPAALPEPPSPSTSNGSSVGYHIPENVRSTPSPRVINGNHASEFTEQPSTPGLTPRQPVRSAGLLSRTISATLNFKF